MSPPSTSTVINPKIKPKQFRKSRGRTQRRLRSENNARAIEESATRMAEQESIVSHAVQAVEDLALDQATTVEDKIVKAAELHAQ